VLLVFDFWCAGLPTLLDPEYEFAVKYPPGYYILTGEGNSPDGAFVVKYEEHLISNANIFFSSWAAFMVALFLGMNQALPTNLLEI
jgi:hypothetical protein